MLTMAADHESRSDRHPGTSHCQGEDARDAPYKISRSTPRQSAYSLSRLPDVRAPGTWRQATAECLVERSGSARLSPRNGTMLGHRMDLAFPRDFPSRRQGLGIGYLGVG